MAGPKGATIVKEELDNEAGKKLTAVKKASSFVEFQETTRRKEQESIKPLSSDREILTDVSKDDVKQLQKDNRLVGWNQKARTALVLKVAFLEKKAKVKKGE